MRLHLFLMGTVLAIFAVALFAGGYDAGQRSTLITVGLVPAGIVFLGVGLLAWSRRGEEGVAPAFLGVVTLLYVIFLPLLLLVFVTVRE